MVELEPHIRLQIARKAAGYTTATDAARRYGWNENTYRSHENGERGLKRSVAIMYARAFNVDPSYILLGAEDARNARSWIVPISGIALNNGHITDFIENILPAQTEFYALCPLSPWEPVLAIEFSSSYGIFTKGDLALFHQRRSNLDEVIGQYALIKTDSNEMMVRLIRRIGDRDEIDLASSWSDPIHPGTVDWMSQLHLIVPGSQWVRRTATEVAKMPTDDEFF